MSQTLDILNCTHFVRSNRLSFKRFTPLACKDKGITKFEFFINTKIQSVKLLNLKFRIFLQS